MKKYFILFLSVFLVLVCSCKKDVAKEDKNSFSVYAEDDGLRIVTKCEDQYVRGTIEVWDMYNGRYNLSVNTAGSGEVKYSLVTSGHNYEVLVYLYDENWENEKYVGYKQITAIGGIGDYYVNGSGVDYDAEAGTISIVDFKVVKPAEYVYAYGYGDIWTT